MPNKILKTGAFTFLIIAFIVRLFPYTAYPILSKDSLKQPVCCCTCGCCSMGKGCCCCCMQMKNQPVQDTGVPCYKGCDCGGNTDFVTSGYSLYHAIFPPPLNLVSPSPNQTLAFDSFPKVNSHISDIITPPPEA
jgi:hypothetical protein